MRRIVSIFLFLFIAVSYANAVLIEPDDFAETTILTNVSPDVTLLVTDDTNTPFDLFVATANKDPFGFAPTGDMVFGHSNIYFFNDNRRLRMDFSNPVSSVSLDFSGSLSSHIGQLQAYNIDGLLLDVYTTLPVRGGKVETMQISRGIADIAYAVAYATGETDFGRLDNLQFTIPEPVTMNLLLLGGLMAMCKRK